jgi:hypothetical protein
MKWAYNCFFLFFVFAAVACSSSRKASSNVEPNTTGLSTQIVSENIFHLPQIPENITSPEERGKFLVMHYWDRFDFNNERLISRPALPKCSSKAKTDTSNCSPHSPTIGQPAVLKVCVSVAEEK